MTLGPGRRAAGREIAAAACALWWVGGCGSAVARILPVTHAGAQQTATDCERLFQRGPFEATHVVEASIPFSDDTSMIGVVVAEANSVDFRSLLLTQEGIVVFDAIRRGESIQVVRALPPIDPDGFGRNMTDDVRLILIHPDGHRPEVGRTREGARICRWSSGEDQVEVLLSGRREAQLTRFRRGSVVRHAWLKGIRDDGFAREILLETTSMVGYQLRLTLLSVDVKNEPAPPSNGP